MIQRFAFATGFALLSSTLVAGNLDDVAVADPVSPIPLQQPDTDWSGFYVGGQFLTGDVNDGAADYDATGFGVHAGYLYDLGVFVVGGEVGYDSFELETGGVESDGNAARLKAVAGYDLGNFMPYVAAGIADLEVEALGGDLNDQIGFYGLGGSYQVNDSFRLGAEYLIHEGDDFDGSGMDVDFDTLSLRGSFSF